MTMSTLRAERSLPRATAARAPTELARDVLELGVLAAIAAIVGAFWPAGVLAVLVLIAGGPVELSAVAFSLGVPMLALTVPALSAWWVWAVATRRSLRSIRAARTPTR